MPIRDLTGRSVLVTGAASGIGHETALAFARAGADIIAVDLDEARLATTVQLVAEAGRQCRPFGCDVSDRAAVEALAATAGTPDVLVNNAGIGYLGPFLDTPLAAWDRVLAVNLMGVVYMCRAFLPGMLAAGTPAHLVNVASAAGLQPVPNLSAYSASKHAVLGLSDGLAMELTGTTIGVTVVCPGVIDTPIVRDRRAVAASVPAAALDKLDQAYRAKGAPPSLVAARILRAVQRGEDIVLAGPGAAAVYHGRRLSRALIRKLGISGARDLGYVW